MVMQAQPVYDAYTALVEKLGRKPWVIYMTPQGRTFNQGIAQELSEKEDIVLLCGHYEGIDERVLEMIVDDYMSIGDFVLTGGELPAMAIVDAVSRLVPGVLNNEDSAEIETFYNNLLEYPEYADARKFKDLLGVLEEKRDLLKLVSESDEDTGRPQVIIGSENSVEEMQDSALVFQ